MTGDFLPEFKTVPMPGGGYKCSYRLFDGQSFRLIPKDIPHETATQALNVAKQYVRQKLNPPIRCEQASGNPDPLGIEAWHRERAALTGELQESALGAIIVRGRQVKVERKRA